MSKYQKQNKKMCSAVGTTTGHIYCIITENKMVKTLALFALLVYNVIARNMGNLAVATRYGQLDHKEVNKL